MMVTQYLKISLEQYAITGRSSKEHVHYLALLGLMGYVPPGVYLITVTADAVVLRVRGVNIVVQRRLIFKAHRRKTLDGFIAKRRGLCCACCDTCHANVMCSRVLPPSCAMYVGLGPAVVPAS